MQHVTKLLIWLLILAVFPFSRALGQPISAVEPLGTADERFGVLSYLEPCDILLDATGEYLFVLNAGSRDLRKISLIGEGPPQLFPFNIEPACMTQTPDGKHIVILGGGVHGRLLLVDAKTLRLEKTVAVGHTPCAVAVSPSGDAVTAYVANRFSGDISVVDLIVGKETSRWQAGREPIALGLTPDGTRLATLGHLPEDSMRDGNPRCRVRIFDTATGDVKTIPLFRGSINARDLVVSPDGRYAFASCLLAHFEHIPSLVDNGWINENVLAVVDLETDTFADMVYLDQPMHGTANPWGLAVSRDNRYLAVAHAGSCEVSLLNLPRIMQRLDNRPNRSTPGFGQYPHLGRNDMGATMPPCVRIPFGLHGMRRLALDVQDADGGQGRIFCVAAYEDVIGRMDFQITAPVVRSYDSGYYYDTPPKPQHVSPPQQIVDRRDGEVAFEPLDALPYQSDSLSGTAVPYRLTFERLEPWVPYEGFEVERSIARLGPPVIWDTIRRGEVLFHDGTYCRQQWQSCVSCHPDARADGINWDLLNDGINNPKNTKSMLFSHETPPAMATGVRADAETAVRAGVHSILFAHLPLQDYSAMDEYLKSLRPVPSPFLMDGQLSDSAKRGKLLFNDARTGCSVCHPESNYYTDMELHDVGTHEYDYYKEYDTPTLIEVWRTAPYLHDGRYETIREVIVEGKHFAADDRLDRLTDQEIDDLVEFVLSL